MACIKRIDGLTKSDVSVAGGKGAALGELMKAGVPVPVGFVVLSGAFEKFLSANELNEPIENELRKVCVEKMKTVESASKKIRALILKSKMPIEIIDEIKNAFVELDARFVAVRSSATSEDSASAAWAGQLDSFLNTTEKELLSNVKKCWASLFTPRAIFYRIENNLQNKKISVAVVVQKMLVSDVSGVAFSTHPVTHDASQVYIEAGLGLGEAVVSGKITPDSYLVGKSVFQIVDKKINKQEKA
ncbi:MAG: PEP/pyruvate-binding domain-containing protein, partial [Parcubacteria group bacterium]